MVNNPTTIQVHGLSWYDDLNKMSTPTNIDWERLCPAISSLPLDDSELLYAIMVHYYFQHRVNDNTSATQVYESIKNSRQPRRAKCKVLPYKGTTFNNNRGGKYLVSNLPVPLQTIIYNYVSYITSQSYTKI